MYGGPENGKEIFKLATFLLPVFQKRPGIPETNRKKSENFPLHSKSCRFHIIYKTFVIEQFFCILIIINH